MNGPWWLNAYDCTLVYGGPEEGGWWYDAGEPTGDRFGPYDTLEETWAARDVLEETWLAAQNEHRHLPKTSVMSDGAIELHVENHEPRMFPEQYPRYE